MSTIRLLDPTHKAAAVRRHTAVNEMLRMARAYQPGSQGRFRIESLAAVLDEVRRDPRFTGAQKDAKFKSLLNRAR
jgi:hypothetical protein